MKSLAALLLLTSTALAQSVPPLRIYDEGNRLPLQYRLNMVGTGVTCVNSPGTFSTVCTFTGGGGGGGGYDTIQDEGSALTQRTVLNFIGSTVTCVDNSGNSRTDCTLSSTFAAS